MRRPALLPALWLTLSLTAAPAWAQQEVGDGPQEGGPEEGGPEEGRPEGKPAAAEVQPSAEDRAWGEVERGFALVQSGQFAEAVAALRPSATWFIDAGVDEGAYVARFHLARALAGAGEPVEADALFAALLPLAEARAQGDAAGLLALTLAAGESLLVAGAVDRARPWAQRTVEQAHRSGDPSLLWFPLALRVAVAGAAQLDEAGHRAVVDELAEAVAAHQGAAGPVTIASMAAEVAAQQVRDQQFAQGWRVAGGALGLMEVAAEDDPDLRARLHNIAGYGALQMGWYEAADGHFEAGRQLQPGDIALVNNAAMVAKARGQLRRAASLYEDALQLAIAEQDQGMIGIVLSNLGGVELALGDLERAEGHYREALSLHRDAGQNRAVLTDLSNLGTTLQAAGRDEEAAEMLTEALALNAEGPSLGLGPWADPSAAGQQYTSLAEALRQLGRLVEAEDALTAASQLFAALQRYGELAQVSGSLGWLRIDQGRFDEAADAFERGLELEALIGLELDGWRSLLGLGVARYRGGQTEAGIEALQESAERVELLRAALPGDDQVAAAFAGNKQEVYQWLVFALLAEGRVEEAFEASERGRGRAFLDLLGGGGAPAPRSVDSALVEELDQIEAEVAELLGGSRQDARGGLRSDGEGAAVRGALRTLDERRKEVVAEIRRSAPGYARQVAVLPPALSEVQASLERGAAMVVYTPVGTGARAFVVTADGIEAVELDATWREIGREVRRFRRRAAEQVDQADLLSDRWRAPLATLYDQLWAPLAGRLEGVERVTVVPAGALHYLPFAALLAPAGGGGEEEERSFLIERHVLSTLPSAAVGVELARRSGRRHSGRSLVVGNPAFDGRFTALPGAEREARTVAGALGRRTVLLTGTGATEPAVRRELSRAGRIHLATHGGLDDYAPLFSFLALAPDAATGGAEGDGLLEVHEVFELSLNAELVTLSACETGMVAGLQGEGRSALGDEFTGLSRAFLYAGADAVLASLWQVDDSATEELMRALYSGSGDPAEQLARAQRAALRARPHPWYWAAFLVVGR